MYRFNPPPGWPHPPTPSWLPPPDWRPDPAWPAAPEGWQWYLPLPDRPRRPSVLALTFAIPWVGLWLLASSLMLMAAASACTDSACNQTLVTAIVLGTGAVDIALLVLWAKLGTGGPARTWHPESVYAAVVIGVPVACVVGFALIALATQP
jgi:hypothetical protein